MRKPTLIGFYLNHDIYFDVKLHRLFQLNGDAKNKSISIKLEVLNETSSHLLASILKYSYNNVVISKNALMNIVWGNDLLKSSTQRLWQLLNELKDKLETFGIERETLIVNRGCYNFSLSSIEPVFTSVKTDDWNMSQS